MNEAWNDFWAGPEGASGCLSARWQAIESVQRRVWQRFAALLPKGAKTLDLATGDGRVMGWMLGSRRDLRLSGIDLADRLPPPPRGTRSRGGVAMESLPVPDHSHDAVVSQFGVEYGDLARVCAEIARVLRSRGRVCLITHRIDGSILAHNKGRRDGLTWALEDVDLIAKARAGLSLRSLGIAVPPAVESAPAEARVRFGDGSSAWELAEAIAQSFRLGWRDPPGEIDKVLGVLEGKARNEIARIDSLEQACRNIADTDRFAAELFEAGLEVQEREPLREAAGGALFADSWLIRKG